MLEEAPILDRDHGVDDVWRQVGDRNGAPGSAALREDAAVARQHPDDRRLLALPQRGRIGETYSVADHRGGKEHRCEDRDEDGEAQQEAHAPGPPKAAAAVARRSDLVCFPTHGSSKPQQG